MSTETEICPLCFTESEFFRRARERDYFRCPNCKGVFMSPKYFLSAEDEKARYETHNNDVDDPGYQNFVRPLVDAVIMDFPKRSHGLDFGAGTGPVLSNMLLEAGYEMTLYDPFFHPNDEALKKQYDFVVSCEVIEHFHHPAREFELLRRLLKPGGKLYCKTDPFTSEIDFEKWYYKNDPTHVFFYHDASCRYIKTQFHFSHFAQNGRVLQFSV
jgi:SAM-dependent methyltransferase